MTLMTTSTATEPNRRTILAGMAAAGLLLLLPRGAQALDAGAARSLVDRLVADINTIIGSGKPEQAMYADFEKLFARYADVPIIAQSSLGVAARQATPAQMKAYSQAFQGYIARKYGRQFREFIGGKVETTGAEQVKSLVEVKSVAQLRGKAPMDVRWHVSDKSGQVKFINIVIEGVNMLATERTEIGAMLDKRKGNIDALIQDLRTAG